MSAASTGLPEYKCIVWDDYNSVGSIASMTLDSEFVIKNANSMRFLVWVLNLLRYWDHLLESWFFIYRGRLEQSVTDDKEQVTTARAGTLPRLISGALSLNFNYTTRREGFSDGELRESVSCTNTWLVIWQWHQRQGHHFTTCQQGILANVAILYLE